MKVEVEVESKKEANDNDSVNEEDERRENGSPTKLLIDTSVNDDEKTKIVLHSTKPPQGQTKGLEGVVVPGSTKSVKEFLNKKKGSMMSEIKKVPIPVNETKKFIDEDEYNKKQQQMSASNASRK